MLFLIAVGLACAPAAAAAQRDPVLERRQIRIGLAIPGDRDRAVQRLAPFRTRVSQATGLKVEIVAFDSGQGLIDALAAERLDYAVLSASGYAMAYSFCKCIEPVAAPRAADGSDGWHAVVLARADGPIHKIADLAGKAVAISSRRSVGGWLVPKAALSADGIDLETLAKRVVATGSPAKAVRALLSGEADAAIVWSSLAGDPERGYSRGPLAELVAAGSLDMTSLRVVWRSPKIPHGPHAVRSALPSPLKTKLRDLLVTLDDLSPEIYDALDREHGGGFEIVDHSAYAPLIDALLPRPEPSELRE